MGYVLILGSNSDIGKVLAEKYASNGYNLLLADADAEKLEEISQYLAETYEIDVQASKFNVLEFYTHRNFYKNLDLKPMGVIFAVDYVGDQKRAQRDFLEAKKIIDINYTGLVSILNIAANDFEERKEGFIAGIGNIVGKNNKQDFYTYYSAKQGFTSHLEGIKNRLSDSNVQVLVVNPGFVHTESTKNIEIKGKLGLIPGDVAENLFDAQQQGKDFTTGKNLLQKILPFGK